MVPPIEAARGYRGSEVAHFLHQSWWVAGPASDNLKIGHYIYGGSEIAPIQEMVPRWGAAC